MVAGFQFAVFCFWPVVAAGSIEHDQQLTTQQE
jgi:hypothetical protein